MDTLGLTGLKQRIQRHYDVCSTYYHSLWGEHVHHGYWTAETSDLSKEDAQVALIQLLLRTAALPPPSSPTASPRLQVLDVGCGLGGTSRYLAQRMGWEVTGVTISTEQVAMARRLSREAAGPAASGAAASDDAAIPLGAGSVRFLAVDGETLGTSFAPDSFDVVWICEALSHFPHKDMFFSGAAHALRPGGSLVVADWFRAPDASEDEIRPIEEGMLLPPLCTMEEYTILAGKAGLEPASAVAESEKQGSASVIPATNWKDISKEVARTWDISLGLIASPSLWAFAFSQGRDFVSFLRAFQAMRTGFASGSFRYGVAAFRKTGVDERERNA